jgi:hypothetical protein
MLLPYTSNLRTEANLNKYKAEIDSFILNQQPLIDSVNIEILQNSGSIDMAIAIQKIKPTTFNPNKYPTEAWRKMGFTDKQIRNIKNYEAKGGKFKRKEDVKKIYSISDVEYEIIEPFISIPSLYKSKTGKVTTKKAIAKTQDFSIIEINSASSADLETSLNLTPYLAKRIISYKNVLGGYINKNQLKEVYGLSENIYNTFEKYIEIDTSLITKIDMNNVEFKQLLKHPYFDYNTTKSIFNNLWFSNSVTPNSFAF